MSKTILCADDSATMQTVAEITFRVTEYNYVGARSADEALQKARAETPILILADAVMPGKDGYELCQAVKNDPALAGVPVVLMCGKSQAYDDAKGAQVGADGHVIKPWDTQQMMDKVMELLGKVDSDGVAKAAGGAAASAPSTAPTPPTPPIPVPSAPPTPAPPSPGAARSATIMGMPTITMPPKASIPGVTPVKAMSPPPRPVAAPTPPKPTPVAAPPKPVAAPPKPVAAPPKPVAAPPKPVAARSAPRPAPPPSGTRRLPQPPRGMPRPPMVKGVPTKRPVAPRRVAAAARVPATAAEVAQEYGLDPSGPEMAALLKISEDVVARIVWEVVPALAEAIIKENLDKFASK